MPAWGLDSSCVTSVHMKARALLRLAVKNVEARELLLSYTRVWSQVLWVEQLQAEALRRQQKGQQGQQAQGGRKEGQQGREEVEDVTGFSAQGLVLLLVGLSKLGALSRMPRTWVQVSRGGRGGEGGGGAWRLCGASDARAWRGRAANLRHSKNIHASFAPALLCLRPGASRWRCAWTRWAPRRWSCAWQRQPKQAWR